MTFQNAFFIQVMVKQLNVPGHAELRSAVPQVLGNVEHELLGLAPQELPHCQPAEPGLQGLPLPLGPALGEGLEEGLAQGMALGMGLTMLGLAPELLTSEAQQMRLL